MTMVVTKTVVLKQIECGTCGMPFALPEEYWNNCYNEGGFFSCPLGHSRGWNQGNKRSVVEELRREKQILESEVARQRERAEAARRSASAARGQVTKISKRIANGVCPCCKRSFANLHRHMTAKHPEFADEQ